MGEPIRARPFPRASWTIAIFSIVSVALFLASRSYKRSNIPLWRAQLPKSVPTYFKIDSLVYIPNKASLLVSDNQLVIYKFGVDGRFVREDYGSDLGQGSDGAIYFINSPQIYQWQEGKKPLLRQEWKSKAPVGFMRGPYLDDERTEEINWRTLQIIGADAHGPVYLWSIDGAKPTLTLPAPDLSPWEEVPYHIALSPDGRWCAVTYGLVQLPGGWPQNEREPGNKWLGLSFFQREAKLVLFDLKSKKPRVLDPKADLSMSSPPRRPMGLNSLRFSPQGRYLAVDGYNFLSVWKTSSGQLLRKITKPRRLISPVRDASRSVCFSPSESLIAVGGEGNIEVFSVSSGQHLQTFNCAKRVTTLSFSPDGKRLLAGCEEGLVYCWDASNL